MALLITISPRHSYLLTDLVRYEFQIEALRFAGFEFFDFELPLQKHLKILALTVVEWLGLTPLLGK